MFLNQLSFITLNSIHQMGLCNEHRLSSLWGRICKFKHSRPLRYVEGGYETDNISRNDVSRDRFSHKPGFKMKRDGSRQSISTKKKYVPIFMKNLQKPWNYNKWKFKEAALFVLKAVHPGYCLQCSTVQVAIYKSWRWLEQLEHWNLSIQRPLLLYNIPTASKNIYSSFSSCCP